MSLLNDVADKQRHVHALDTCSWIGLNPFEQNLGTIILRLIIMISKNAEFWVNDWKFRSGKNRQNMTNHFCESNSKK